MNGTLLGFSRGEMEEKFERIVNFAELEHFIDAPIRTYSSGMVARLGFAIATDVKPDILIVDEVLAVGDEAFQRKSMARMQEFREQGATILLVSHDVNTVQAMCARAVWIDHGVVKADGASVDVVEAYLAGYDSVWMVLYTGTGVKMNMPTISSGTPITWLQGMS